MAFQWLGTLFVVLTLGGCLFAVGVAVSFITMMRRHQALRPGGVAREAEALAHPLPPDDALPHVVVQIACYNEGRIVERSVVQATRLDWPRSRLHVQICDDSTDGTTRHAEEAARLARTRGFDVTVLHRETRRDFKAGALQEAMATTEHEYFLVFDVDFVYPPDFLRRCMAGLLADPDLAFVQARIDAFNGDATVLTRAQRIILDFHHGFDQAYRSWTGALLPFNGTGGVWRRAAIEAAGGWSGATVTEDLDLTCRAWLKGWRGTYLTSVVASSELPTRLSDWMAQNRRWMAGYGEVARRMLPELARDTTARAGAQWTPSSPLAFWVACVLILSTVGTAVAAAILDPGSARLVTLAVTGALGSIAVALFAVTRTANRFCRPDASLWSFSVDFVPVPLLTLYIGWASFRSVPATLLGRRRAFIRTPKSVLLPVDRGAHR